MPVTEEEQTPVWVVEFHFPDGHYLVYATDDIEVEFELGEAE